MSLFKARDWWSTLVGEDEEFDQGCLCAANIDNSNNGQAKLIVGSYHGFLRIYNPRPRKTEEGWSRFKPEDVICETQLSQPIIQVEAGRFLSGSEGIHLAVLHPRKLSVYSLVGTAGAVEHGSHYQLKLAYEHNVQRTTFNMCFGPFGGVKGRDFICVQSMDGTVSVFEQESFAFCRFLPGALLPGPLRYIESSDSFILVSSSRQVESYRYQVLAVATDAKTKEESQNLRSGKRVAHDWVFNLGEQALDMQYVNFPNAPATIFVLGERNLFALTEGGKLRFMKKFDYSPSCFIPYGSVKENVISCIVGTHTKTLLIYEDITLKWAAQLTHVPVQVRVANLPDLRGAIVTLDEEGHLQCSYLGTDPAMFNTPTSEVRELDYADMDNEMHGLQKIIKQQQSKIAAPMPNVKEDAEITVNVHVPPNLDEPSLAHDLDFQDVDTVPSITIKISLRSKIHANDVQLSVHVAPPLGVNENLITFSSLEPSHPGETQVSCYMKQGFLPADMRGQITVNYQSASGAPRVIHTTFRLPLKLVTKACLPVKAATFKVTLDTNKPPVNLNDLFPDLLGENAGGPGNALGFQYYGQEPVITLLASKTSQRYRMQCDDFASLWPLVNELVARLNTHFKVDMGGDFNITFDSALPLQEYFDVMDQHFEFRANDERLQKLLEERAAQFRAIQRRLLTRFKDKTPAPLGNLDTLLDGTYRQLLALAEAVQENSVSMQRAAAALSCATRTINLLIRFWQRFSKEQAAILEAALSPDVTSNGSQGWEETVDAAVTHLLRTCLAKSAKDQTVNPAPLGMLKDTTKLKKHIALVCDRLSKGSKLSVEGYTASPTVAEPAPVRQRKPEPASRSGHQSDRKSRKAIPTTLDSRPDRTRPDPGLGEAEVPVGSRLGEARGGGGGRGSGPPQSTPLPMNGTLPPPGGREPGQMQELPPVTPGAGSRFMKAKRKDPDEEGEEGTGSVPDLDDLGSAAEDLESPFMNGGDELVYGL